jgi:hypothetical protein
MPGKHKPYPVWTIVERNILLSPPTGKPVISKYMTVCGRYQCQKKLHITFNEVPYTKIQIPTVRERAYRIYRHALCLEKRDLNSGLCSQLFSYSSLDKQTHSDSDL